ncbi:TetR/AcrR family transcriptional regulator [Sphingomonas japonica]|uniref:TetR/AcrR family transcriptional repressor of mexJK operon n=1 Tax=Sphingomonas japonica TaxID=511662 RepID=A0ABX0U2U6_9SPHN|nr:TetR/AcrR family transcriptional regulator [Sphingomonas japonica]NIJ24049.1 TetR/AcrR family transcriptional repressor of mexJK operon [Sphingomonas japonica]
MAAARDSFFERGVSASTIEDIAQRAGVSKVTVYNRFGDKDTLFEQVVRAETGRMADVLEAGFDGSASFEARVNAYGESLLGFMFAKDHVAFDRVVMADLAQNPALCERFFAAGPGHCRGRLAEVIAQAQKAGLVEVDDPERAAEDLTSLWKGFADVELKFGVVSNVCEETIRAKVARGTKVFLRAYAPRASVEKEKHE